MHISSNAVFLPAAMAAWPSQEHPVITLSTPAHGGWFLQVNSPNPKASAFPKGVMIMLSSSCNGGFSINNKKQLWINFTTCEHASA